MGHYPNLEKILLYEEAAKRHAKNAEYGKRWRVEADKAVQRDKKVIIDIRSADEAVQAEIELGQHPKRYWEVVREKFYPERTAERLIKRIAEQIESLTLDCVNYKARDIVGISERFRTDLSADIFAETGVSVRDIHDEILEGIRKMVGKVAHVIDVKFVDDGSNRRYIEIDWRKINTGTTEAGHRESTRLPWDVEESEDVIPPNRTMTRKSVYAVILAFITGIAGGVGLGTMLEEKPQNAGAPVTEPAPKKPKAHCTVDFTPPNRYEAGCDLPNLATGNISFPRPTFEQTAAGKMPVIFAVEEGEKEPILRQVEVDDPERRTYVPATLFDGEIPNNL